jgi:L-fuculose-phosphate aldolase
VLYDQYYKVLTLGTANILNDDEMTVLLDKFKSYGRNAAER